MNSKSAHINASIKKHYGAFGDELSINPISRADIDIVNELVEILKKHEIYDAVAVMDSYKKDSDTDISEQLIEINTYLSDPSNIEDTEDKKLPYWLFFSNTPKKRIKRSDLHNFSPADGVGNNGWYFGILINETPDDAKKVPLNANLMLLYEDEETRDADIEMLEDLNNY